MIKEVKECVRKHVTLHGTPNHKSTDKGNYVIIKDSMNAYFLTSMNKL